jgi:hypothetical protein
MRASLVPAGSKCKDAKSSLSIGHFYGAAPLLGRLVALPPAFKAAIRDQDTGDRSSDQHGKAGASTNTRQRAVHADGMWFAALMGA